MRRLAALWAVIVLATGAYAVCRMARGFSPDTSVLALLPPEEGALQMELRNDTKDEAYIPPASRA